MAFWFRALRSNPVCQCGHRQQDGDYDDCGDHRDAMAQSASHATTTRISGGNRMQSQMTQAQKITAAITNTPCRRP